MAVKTVAWARGMVQLAKDSGVGLESLYKALMLCVKTIYDTILKVIRVLRVKLHITAA